MYKTELDWVSAYKKLEVEVENKDKRIAELEAQIEKMKCCENCKHHYIALDDTTSCKLLDRFASSKPCDKWEIKEK